MSVLCRMRSATPPSETEPSTPPEDEPRATRTALRSRATSSSPVATDRAWWVTSSTDRSGPIWARATASASAAAFSWKARYSASGRYGFGGHGVGTTVATTTSSWTERASIDPRCTAAAPRSLGARPITMVIGWSG